MKKQQNHLFWPLVLAAMALSVNLLAQDSVPNDTFTVVAFVQGGSYRYQTSDDGVDTAKVAELTYRIPQIDFPFSINATSDDPVLAQRLAAVIDKVGRKKTTAEILADKACTVCGSSSADAPGLTNVSRDPDKGMFSLTDVMSTDENKTIIRSRKLESNSSGKMHLRTLSWELKAEVKLTFSCPPTETDSAVKSRAKLINGMNHQGAGALPTNCKIVDVVPVHGIWGKEYRATDFRR